MGKILALALSGLLMVGLTACQEGTTNRHMNESEQKVPDDTPSPASGDVNNQGSGSLDGSGVETNAAGNDAYPAISDERNDQTEQSGAGETP